MKKLLSLAVAGAALAALALPTYAKTKEEKAAGGRAKAEARGEVRERVVQQPPRSMQHPARAAANIERRDVRSGSSRVTTRARVDSSGRTITRSEPSVAFGGQTRAERRERTVAVDRTEFRRDRDRDLDRGEFRFRRPPITTYRTWDRDRIYTWDNHRWHWYGGNWVIVDASPGYVYYDEPIATTYVATSGSLVARVQRELSRDGYDPGPVDGVMGGQTRSAIIAFQRDNGMPVTGRIDSALLNELNLN
jgi:Putative peptidoglycan binding domain